MQYSSAFFLVLFLGVKNIIVVLFLGVKNIIVRN